MEEVTGVDGNQTPRTTLRRLALEAGYVLLVVAGLALGACVMAAVLGYATPVVRSVPV